MQLLQYHLMTGLLMYYKQLFVQRFRSPKLL
ncbi:MAG: hypothetical protein ACJA1Z_001576 [Patiriisocius sp.]